MHDHKALMPLCLAATCALAGCADNGSDERLRQALGIPSQQAVTEALVAERTMALIPIGSTEPEVRAKAEAMGVHRANHSSYTLLPERDMVVLRFDLDTGTLGLTHSQWIITLHLDKTRQVRSVEAKRYLTGL